MEEKNIISKLHLLKQIKPNKEWAFSLRNDMFRNTPTQNKESIRSEKSGFLSDVFNLILKRKLAYTFAAILFIFSGIFGLTGIINNGNDKVILENSPAALVNFDVKSGIDEFKIKSQSLVEATKNNSKDIPLVAKEVKNAVKNLTDAIQKNPELAKEVAIELKNSGTLASLDGRTDLQENSDILYKALIEQIIKDDEDTTHSELQGKVLLEVKDLYNEGKYSEALIKRLSDF